MHQCQVEQPRIDLDIKAMTSEIAELKQQVDLLRKELTRVSGPSHCRRRPDCVYVAFSANIKHRQMKLKSGRRISSMAITSTSVYIKRQVSQPFHRLTIPFSNRNFLEYVGR